MKPKRQTQRLHNWKIGFVSFFITLLLISAICAFAVVDSRSRQFGFGDFAPVFEVSYPSDTQLNLSVMGKNYLLDLQLLRELEEIRKQYLPLTPTWVRFGEQLTRLVQEEIDAASKRRKEAEFEAYVAEDEQELAQEKTDTDSFAFK